VENYAQIEELLSDAEMKGRRWVFDRAQSGDHDGSTPTDHDILEVHRVMFSEFLDWAGTTRRDDRGPGGRVPVPWPDVRIQLRNLSLDLAAWIGDISILCDYRSGPTRLGLLSKRICGECGWNFIS
jgi:hypothetical protein